MTQAQFQIQYDEYLIYMGSKNIDVFALDIRPLYSWIVEKYKIESSDWQRTGHQVTDFYGHKFDVYEIEGHKFITNRIKDILIAAPKQKLTVKGCNSQYNRTPYSCVSGSYYNFNKELIFYVDHKQETDLSRQLQENLQRQKDFDEYEKIKPLINRTEWQKINTTVAMDLLESVPPARMDRLSFLFGEAIDQTPEGKYIYRHCEKINGQWYIKDSTIEEYENEKVVIDDRSE